MIEFSQPEKDAIVGRIKAYFQEELGQEIGAFEAEFLLDFFAKEIGGYFYNRAITDVHALLDTQLESMVDAIYQLEQPIPSGRS